MKYRVKKLDMDNKLKYLEMIQNIIERMANNCFLLKGWSITLITVIFALSDQTLKQDYFLFAYIPVIVLWFLDSYYLQLERKYKVLYEIAIKKDINEIDFDLSIDGITYDKLNLKKVRIISCICSRSEVFFYIPIIIIMTIIFWERLSVFLGI